MLALEIVLEIALAGTVVLATRSIRLKRILARELSRLTEAHRGRA